MDQSVAVEGRCIWALPWRRMMTMTFWSVLDNQKSDRHYDRVLGFAPKYYLLMSY